MLPDREEKRHDMVDILKKLPVYKWAIFFMLLILAREWSCGILERASYRSIANSICQELSLDAHYLLLIGGRLGRESIAMFEIAGTDLSLKRLRQNSQFPDDLYSHLCGIAKHNHIHLPQKEEAILYSCIRETEAIFVVETDCHKYLFYFSGVAF